MKIETKKLLRNLSDVDRYELQYALDIAFKITSLKNKYKLSNKELSKGLFVPERRIKDALEGTFEYSVKTIAALNAFTEELRVTRTSKNTVIVKSN